MISEQELFEMPRGVRERFQAFSDDDFASHPEIATLRARLAELEAEHREAATMHHGLNVRLRGLQNHAEWARGEALRLNEGRARRLAEILLSGDHDLAQDRAVLAQIAELHHFSDAVTVALPQIERTIAQASSNTRQIVSSQQGLEDALRGLLDRLKLAEPERQAYA